MGGGLGGLGMARQRVGPQRVEAWDCHREERQASHDRDADCLGRLGVREVGDEGGEVRGVGCLVEGALARYVGNVHRAANIERVDDGAQHRCEPAKGGPPQP